MNDIIHCLKCDDTYLEVQVCPSCGNDDKMQTVALAPESEMTLRIMKALTDDV